MRKQVHELLVVERLQQLDARLSDPATPLWFEELTEPFRHSPALLDPEIQPVWERVRGHAEQLRQQIARVSWKDQVAGKERLDRMEAALAAIGQTGAESHQLLDQHTHQLRELIEQAARRQLLAIEAEHQQTVALLEKLGSANSHNCRSDQCLVNPREERKPTSGGND